MIAVNSTFWNLVYGAADKSPERMCEILAAWLRRQLRLARETDAGEHSISFKAEQFADEPIARAARSAPEYYIKCVLPIVVSMSSWAAVSEGGLPRKDRLWRHLMVRDYGQEPHDAALSHLQDALENVSSNSPDKLQDYVNSLKQADTYIANILLMCIFAGNGKHFGHEAVELFAEQPWRFQSGVVNNSQWFAQKAIKSVSMNCSADDLATLESTILQYVSPWEKDRFGYKDHGRARFNLLAAIPLERRSHRVNVAFRELERKFGEPTGEPEGVRGGLVGPPISEDKLGKMDDQAILAAISHYSANERPRGYRDFLKGGNLEFARAIGTMAAKEPYRFAQLATRIPDNSAPEYLCELLRALEKASIDDALKLQVGSKAFAEHRESCGREIADLLGAIEDPLPQDALEQLSWLALYSSDPKEELWKKEISGGTTVQVSRGWSIWTG